MDEIAAESSSPGEIKFRALLEASTDAVFLLTAAGQICECNTAAVRRFGYTRAELLGLTAADLGLDRAQSETARFEALCQMKDGQPFTAEVSAYPVALGPEPQRLVCVCDVTGQREVERALQLSEAKYRLLADSTYDWELWVDPGGQVIYCSPSAERISGYLPAAFEQDPDLLRQRMHPADLAAFDAHRETERLAAKGELTLRLVHRDGSEHYLNHVCQPIYDANDVFLGTRISNRDVTERKQSEAALSASETRYRRLIETLPDAVLLLQAGQIVFLNPTAEALLGVRVPGGLLGAPLLEYIHPDDQELALAHWRQASEGQASQPVEIRMLSMDGRVLDIETKSIPTRYGGGAAVLVVGRDLTERKRAAAALNQSEQNYRALFASIQEGFALHEIICDAYGRPCDYRFLEANPAFEALTGLQPERIIGQTVLSVLPDLEPDWVEIYSNVALTGQPVRFERYAAALGRYYEVIAFSPRPGQFATVFTDNTERKKAEDALRESEARYKRLLESVTSYVYTVEVQGGQPVSTTHGPGCVAVTGYTPEEYAANPLLWHSMVHNDDKTAVTDQAARVLAGGGSSQLEHRIWCKNGTIRWVRNTSVPHYDGQGRLVAYEGVITDITERRVAEETLRESEARYRTLFEQANDAIFLETEDDRILDVNRRACELLGYSREQLLTKRVSELQAPEFRRPGNGVIREELAQHGSRPFEGVDLHRSGRRIAVEIANARLTDMGGTVIMSIVRDISERKRAEAQLRESEEKYRQIVDTANEGIWGVDADARTTFANRRLAEMLGYTPEAMLGRAYDAFLYEADLADHAVKMAARRRGVAEHYERRFRRKDGQTLWAIVSATPLFDDAHQIVGSFEMLTDITERKQAEAALREGEARYRAIVEGFDGLIYICSQDYRLEFMNQRLIERTGYDAVGQKCHQVLHGLNDRCPWCLNAQAPKGDKVYWEFHSAHDGRWYYEVNTPIYHADGSLSKQAMIQDIT